MKRRPFIPLLIIAAGIWAWHNSFHGPFIFDDRHSILENSHIHRLWPIWSGTSGTPCSISGRPVVGLTLALNYALNGLNVWGYHAVNLTAHLLCALLLFGILRRTFEGDKLRGRFGAASVWLAGAIALIWEVHPLQTESVNYIVQRAELLMGLFLLLALYCTLHASQSSDAGPWYLAAIASCALGMGSKEVMVAAPLIVLLYDRVFLTGSFRESWQQRRDLYTGLAATWLILAVLVARTPHAATGFGITGLTPWSYLKTEAGVIVYYLRLCLWPRPLVLDYFDWPITSSLQNVLLPGAVVLGLLGATLWAFRRHPSAGFLGAWFFLILAPTSSILPSTGEMAAERRMYLPLAAVVTMAVVGAYALGRRLWSKQHGALLGAIATASVVVLFAFLTIQRNQDYQSAVTIWQDTLNKRPDNARAHIGLGFALVQLGRLPDAIAHYEQALQIKPDYLEAHNDFGTALMRQDRLIEAVDQYEQALRLKPDYAQAHDNLGLALARLGRLPEAIDHWQQALKLNPDLSDAHNNLGFALEQQGRVQEAISQYQEALRINPANTEARINLANALRRSNGLVAP